MPANEIFIQDYMEEPLRAFFNNTLPKITDAELDILVQYIFALLTNADEKSTKESLKGELTDFLGDNTDGFVKDMFAKIEQLKKDEENRVKNQKEKKASRRVVEEPPRRERERERERERSRRSRSRSPRDRRNYRDRERGRHSTRKKRKRDRDLNLLAPLFQPLGIRKRNDQSNVNLQHLIKLSNNLPAILQALSAKDGKNQEPTMEEVQALQQQINSATLAGLAAPGKIDLDELQAKEQRTAALNFRTGGVRQPFRLPHLLTGFPQTPPTEIIRTEPAPQRPLFPKRGMKRRQSFGNNSYGAKRQWNSYDGWNSKRFPEHEEKEVRQLFLKNIPAEKNNIGALSIYFQEFGTVEHIQVHSDSNKAFVQFASRDDAKRAMECKGAVMDVPAITKLWAHYNRRSKMNMGGNNSGGRRRYQPTIKQRRMQQNIMNSFTQGGEDNRDGVLPPRPRAPQPVNAPVFADSNTLKDTCSPLLQKCEEKIQEIDGNLSNTKNKIDETMKLMAALKGKKGDNVKDMRKTCLKNLNTFMSAMDALLKRKRTELLKRKNLEARVAQSRRDPKQLSSEALDRDLDLYNKAGRKRNQAVQNQILDLRPAILRVRNLHSSMNELLLKVHFQNFGEIMTVDIRGDVAYVKYKNRTEAEEALRSGGKLPNFMNGIHKFELELTDAIPDSDGEDVLPADPKLDKAFDEL